MLNIHDAQDVTHRLPVAIERGWGAWVTLRLGAEPISMN
jgi:hypothetical protein